MCVLYLVLNWISSCAHSRVTDDWDAITHMLCFRNCLCHYEFLAVSYIHGCPMGTVVIDRSYSISQEICTRFLLCCALLWLYIDWFSHIHHGFFHWHCGNLTIAPVPAKQPWWIWINTSCEFIMNDCITTTKQSTTKPCAYFLGYTVQLPLCQWHYPKDT